MISCKKCPYVEVFSSKERFQPSEGWDVEHEIFFARCTLNEPPMDVIFESTYFNNMKLGQCKYNQRLLSSIIEHFKKNLEPL